MTAPQIPSQLRSTILYLLTVFLTQASSFVLLPIITRYLGPSQYGEYALALAVSSLIGMFGSSWIRNVGFRFYFDAKLSGDTRSYFRSLATLQAAILALAYAAAAMVLPLFSQDLVPLPTLLAAAAMMLASDFQALTVYLVRGEQLAGRYALAEGSTALTRLIGTTGGLALGFTEPAFLFLAAAGASVIGGLIALRSLLPHLTGHSRLSWPTMRRVLVRAPGALPFSVGEWLGTLADRLVLNAYATTAVVGIYAAGFGLGDRIVGGIAMAVFMMAWPDVLRSWNDGGIERARVAVHRYFQIYLWLTVGPVVALVVYGEAVVQVLGDGFQGAVQVLGLIAVAAWLRGFGNGFNRHFELEKRFYALSLVTVAGACLNLGLNLLLVPQYQALGAAMAAVGAQGTVMVSYVLLRHRGLVWFPASDALLVAGLTAVTAGISYLWSGGDLVGLLVFAGTYAVGMATVWLRRLRRREPSDG